MGMQTSKGADEPITEINIAPLVDICLVLVIIFMVTVPIMMTVSPVKVELPKANTVEPREDVNIIVALDPNDSMAVDTKKCSMDEFPALLQAAVDKKGTDKMVVVRADRNATHLRTLYILDVAKKAGCERLSFGTTQK